MTLTQLTKDLFLFVSAFRDRLENNSLPNADTVFQEALNIFHKMDRDAEKDEALQARYKKIRFGLVALLDEVVFTSDWESGQEWPLLEERFYNSNMAGDEVYEMVQELTPADNDLAEIWFYIFALGFRGKYLTRPQEWNDVLVSLHRRLPQDSPNRDQRLTPEAYRVIAREGRRLDPLFNLWRSALIFFGAMILLLVLYQTVWWSIVAEAKTLSLEVIEDVRDDELRESIKQQSGVE